MVERAENAYHQTLMAGKWAQKKDLSPLEEIGESIQITHRAREAAYQELMTPPLTPEEISE